MNIQLKSRVYRSHCTFTACNCYICLVYLASPHILSSTLVPAVRPSLLLRVSWAFPRVCYQVRNIFYFYKITIHRYITISQGYCLLVSCMSGACCALIFVDPERFYGSLFIYNLYCLF